MSGRRKKEAGWEPGSRELFSIFRVKEWMWRGRGECLCISDLGGREGCACVCDAANASEWYVEMRENLFPPCPSLRARLRLFKTWEVRA